MNHWMSRSVSGCSGSLLAGLDSDGDRSSDEMIEFRGNDYGCDFGAFKG